MVFEFGNRHMNCEPLWCLKWNIVELRKFVARVRVHVGRIEHSSLWFIGSDE